MTMQNLVLSVQNSVPIRELGSATATVSFFRSLGGAIGVSALGAILASHVRHSIVAGLTAAGVPATSAGDSSTLPNPSTLPPVIRTVIESAYGKGTATIFLFAVPLLVLAFVAVLFIREVPLRTTTAAGAEGESVTADGGEAVGTAAPVEPPVAVTGAADAGMTGSVRTSSGHAIADARVSLLDPDGDTVATTRTAADGSFRLAAAPGAYLLLAAADEAAPAVSRVTLDAPSADPAPVRDVVLETTGTLAGRVRRAGDGSALAGARVLVTGIDGSVLGTDQSAEDGGFTIEGLPAGPVQVVGEHPGTAPLARSARIGAGARTVVTLDLAAGGVLTGVVRASTDDRPLPDADVTLFDRRGVPFAAATTDANGRYRFSEVPPGEYSVTATGFAPVTQQVSTRDGDAVIEFRLGPTAAAPEHTPAAEAADRR
jgi:hypothetical protein